MRRIALPLILLLAVAQGAFAQTYWETRNAPANLEAEWLGDNSLADTSGNARDLTWAHAAYVSAVYGGDGFDLSVTGSDASLGDVASMRLDGADASLEFWVYFPTSGGSNSVYVGKRGSDGWQLKHSISGDHKIRFDTFAANGNNEFGNYTNTVATNTWIHVAVVKDTADTEYRFYVNGSPHSTIQYTDEPADSGASYEFGDGNEGAIARYRHWARQLTEPEIAQLAAGPEPTNSVAPTLTIDADDYSSTDGTWDSHGNGSISYAYQLQVEVDESWEDVTDETGATGSSGYAPGTYRLKVTASNDGGSYQPKYSSEQVVESLVEIVNTRKPIVYSDNYRGGEAYCTTGAFTGSGEITHAFQWTRDDVPIGGATSQIYTLVEADETKRIRCVVTPTDDNGAGDPVASLNYARPFARQTSVTGTN